MKDRLIHEISTNLEAMRGHSAIVQQHVWDLKTLEMFDPREQESLGHMAEHLVAVNRLLNSYIVLMEGFRS